MELKPLKIYKGKYNTYFYVDKKKRRRGYYISSYAAKVGLETYLKEEAEKDAETAQLSR